MAEPSKGSTLVIVESPTKVKTIGEMLPGYVVEACVGHVRDLPDSAADIPAKLKKEDWARIGVNVKKDFEPLYIVPKAKKKTVSKLRAAVKRADRVYFATDEDREGESISWHLLELLKPKVPCERLVFHEITKDAIYNALEDTRPINLHLVEAQETRRIVDRLFGYKLSPLLWKKMVQGLSAGRVQSVAVRLLVERERERIRFTSAGFWGMKAYFAKDGAEFEADLVEVGGQRIVVAKDFEPDTGELKPTTRGARGAPLLLDEVRARQLAEAVRAGNASVSSVDAKKFRRSPKPPYVTSTLQQEANAKLGFKARDTMSLAQQLYQNGFITYMRTDSTMLSDEAKSAARTLIVDEFGQEYVSEEVRFYRNKVKNAQEAHEAIRPAGGQFRTVDEVRRHKQLGPAAAKLYEMIWRRTLASQMRDAQGTSAIVHVDVGEARFRATGSTIEFAGYLKAYPSDLRKAGERALPPFEEGDSLTVASVDESEHRTQPPQRYTEGSLIQRLESLGIGRPSTWATIVDRVQDRYYAFKRDRALVPTFTAMAVVSLLEEHFTRLVDYEFTARLEDQLDAIARGEMQRLEYLNQFYSGDRGQSQQSINGDSRDPASTPEGLDGLVTIGEAGIDPREACRLRICKGPDRTVIEVRIGKYGPFVSWGERTGNIPDNLAPDELSVEKVIDLVGLRLLGLHPKTSLPVYLKKYGRYGPYVQHGDESPDGKPQRADVPKDMDLDSVDLEAAIKLLDDTERPRCLGIDPGSSLPVFLKKGRYGWYLQLGEDGSEKKPKRVSLPKDIDPYSADFGTIIDWVALPRELGSDSESGEKVLAGIGRYGPYVKRGKEYRSIPSGESPLIITLERALELLAEERRGRGRDAGSREPLKVLDNHPVTGKELKILPGRYGPYVTDGEINASLPKDADPDGITLDQAVDLLQARADRIAADGGAKSRRRAKQARRRSAA